MSTEPKIDTLVAPPGAKNSEPFVFTPLMEQLREAHLLIQGYRRDHAKKERGRERERERRSEYFADMHTMAGAGIDWSNDTIRQFLMGSDSQGNIENQIQLCRRISDLTKERISELGKILNDAPEQTRIACRNRIILGVVKTIEEIFPQAYFLPVSALGTIHTKLQEEKKALEFTPNSINCKRKRRH